MSSTIWSVLPPLIAIALALITKEVYLSLFIGILTGCLLYTNFNPIGALVEGIHIMSSRVGANMEIMIFLALLGMIVYLITRSGASRAYGEWASGKIKTKKSAMLASMLLGTLIFVDDYFNCLAVGTVMRPVTDKYKISRAKLAFLIDATAAPVCIIAPISSWAAAVGSSLPENSGIDGFSLFIRTIPFNLYAILMLCFLLFMILGGIEFGTMKRYHDKIKAEGREERIIGSEDIPEGGSGNVLDLIIPIGALILLCLLSMLYTGGFFEGAGLIEAFSNCSPALGLAMGAVLTMVVIAVLYLPRRIISFHCYCESFSEGVKSMIPSMMILAFAWTLSGICSEEYLNLGGYVNGLIDGNMLMLSAMPALLFVIALGLAFATGTSWGTFGILIPIAAAVIQDGNMEMLAFCIAAILAGSVCGDHISPISDTTILSSAGAQCNHITHVSTQIPYALLVAGCCLIGYLLGGIFKNGWIALATGGIALAVCMAVLRKTACVERSE